MSSTQLVVMAIVLITLVAAAIGAWTVLRRQSLKQQFGTEYDRVVEASESRLAAEHELRDRQRRHSDLELHELSPQAREQYAAKWRELQIQFIDAPAESVTEADDLVTQLIEERGYPSGDYREQIAHLSVEHASTLESYREAHEISLSNRRGEATTEQLRLALVHFRALVAQLLGEQPSVPQPSAPQPSAPQPSAPRPDAATPPKAEVMHPQPGEVHV